MQDATILNKIKKELELAKANEHNRQVLLRHMNNIKLLSELFLEEEEVPIRESSIASFSEQEIKVMLGDKKSSIVEKKQPTAIDHDVANGDSIFDF